MDCHTLALGESLSRSMGGFILRVLQNRQETRDIQQQQRGSVGGGGEGRVELLCKCNTVERPIRKSTHARTQARRRPRARRESERARQATETLGCSHSIHPIHPIHNGLYIHAHPRSILPPYPPQYEVSLYAAVAEPSCVMMQFD